MALSLRNARVPALAVALLASAFLSAPALAQGGSEHPPAQRGPKPAQNVTNQELDQAAAIVTELQRIKANYSEEMKQAEDKQQAQQIQQTMQQEMRQAVQENGLTVNRYKRIISAAQQKDDLQQKLMQRVQEREAQ